MNRNTELLPRWRGVGGGQVPIGHRTSGVQRLKTRLLLNRGRLPIENRELKTLSEMEDNQPQPDNNQQRPPMLTLLCIFTFAGSGLSAFANLVLYLYYDLIKQMFEKGQFSFLNGGVEKESLKMLMNISPGFFLFQGILYLISLMGAIMMWKLNKTGFHFYAIAQILLLIIFEFYIPGAPFPIIPLLFSIIFILLYYRNFRFMK